MAITKLTKGTAYRALVPRGRPGRGLEHGTIRFVAARDQEVERFIRASKIAMDYDRIFYASERSPEGGTSMLVVKGSIEGVE